MISHTYHNYKGAPTLPIRLRKFIGLLIFVAVLFIYVWLAMELSALIIDHTTPPIFNVIFYAIAGFLWVIPAGAVIYWMAKQK